MSASTSHETAAVARVSVPAVAAAQGEYLSFRLGAEEYGIDILRVQEIRGFEQPTRLAGAPETSAVSSICGGPSYPSSTSGSTSGSKRTTMR